MDVLSFCASVVARCLVCGVQGLSIVTQESRYLALRIVW